MYPKKNGGSITLLLSLFSKVNLWLQMNPSIRKVNKHAVVTYQLERFQLHEFVSVVMSLCL